MAWHNVVLQGYLWHNVRVRVSMSWQGAIVAQDPCRRTGVTHVSDATPSPFTHGRAGAGGRVARPPEVPLRNPSHPPSARDSSGDPAAAGSSVSVSGPSAPQPGVMPLGRGLPIARVRPGATLCVVGAHGGAGESTLAALEPEWVASGHCWPAGGVPMVLIARTHLRGLLAAQDALTQWAASAVPPGWFLGLVLVPDAPGRLPPPLRDFAQIVAGGAPRVWELPWVEQWRMADPAAQGDDPSSVAAVRRPRRLNKIVSDLRSLASTNAGANFRSRSMA